MNDSKYPARKPDVTSFFHDYTNTVTHVVRDPESDQCAVIDPVLDYDPKAASTSTESVEEVLAFIEKQGLAVEWILETHAHADHLTAAPYIQDTLDAGRTPIAIGENITIVQKAFREIYNLGNDFTPDGSQFDRLFADGDTFSIGGLGARVLQTPGHTPACISYVIGDAVFVGDTMFMPDYGTARCDFPGGDAATLYQSIHKLFALPDATRMFLCHDYLPEGREDFVWETTVRQQKAENIHVNESVTEDQFVKMRTDRDQTLSMPELILPAIQVNIRAGHFPPPEDNGTAYLKLPLNTL